MDMSAIIRHTETPVVLDDGTNIGGFASQHIVRRFRYPGLSVFGLFTVRQPRDVCTVSLVNLLYQFTDDLVVSEITQITPKGARLTDHTASLTIRPRFDFSNVKIVQDHRDKSILKGLSAIGGLWTFVGFLFGALYGSSLVRVVFGMFTKIA